MNKVAELIKSIASSLVDKPEEVEIHEVTGDTTTVYELKVAQEAKLPWTPILIKRFRLIFLKKTLY